MAVLKLLSVTLNKFAWRTDDLFPAVRRPSAGIFLPSALAVVALIFLASPAMSAGAAQQAARAGTAPVTSGKTVAPQQAIDLVNEGNRLLERNDFTAAEAALQRAVQEYPAFAAAHRGLGMALWRQGQLGRAWQELSTVAQLEPESAQAHFELGRLAWHIYSGAAEKAAATAGLSPDDFRSLALSEVEKAASLSPRDFNMRLELSELEVDAGRRKEAQADALGAIPLATSASERSLAHVALARASLATGDQMRAEAEYKKAIEENPASGGAYLGLGQICLLQQNPAEAEKYFQQAVHVSPDLAPAYAALAKLLVDTHQRTEALAMLQKAVALDPEDWQSQYELAKLDMEAGESEAAKNLFTKIIAEQPDFLPAGEQLALMRLRQGDVPGAMARAQTLVARNPRAAEGHRVLALAFWRERQTDASLAECALALNADPQSTSMLALQALELWQTKRRRDAQRVLREVAHRDPSILSAMTFCRLIVCGVADFPLVSDFLHQNRWILEPPDTQ
jgi:tetratricopeptide (TPR) repeat protein